MRLRSRPGNVAAPLALVALLLMVGPGGADPDALRIREAEGPVQLATGTPPVWRAARAGDALGPGDAVRTGRGGRAELALGAATVRLFENSLLRIPVDGLTPRGVEAVRLEEGRSLFEVLKGRLDRAFEVRTPTVVVSVKGTRFGVLLGEDAASVEVYRGLVGVRAPAAAEEMLVRAGFAAVGGPGQSFELELIPDRDPWDGWAVGVELPAPAVADPGGRAVDSVRRAGREAARAEVVERLAVERPEVVRPGAAPPGRKSVRSRAEAVQVDRVDDAKRFERVRPEVGGVSPVRPERISLPADLDPVLDARSESGRASRTLRESGPAGMPTAKGLDPRVTLEPLPGNAVKVELAGTAVVLTEQELKDLVSGDPDAVDALAPQLEALGLDPADVAHQLGGP